MSVTVKCPDVFQGGGQLSTLSLETRDIEEGKRKQQLGASMCPQHPHPPFSCSVIGLTFKTPLKLI